MLPFLAVLLVAAPAFARQESEEVSSFRKYYPTFKDAASRKEAVLSLEGVQDASVIEATIPLLTDPRTEIEVRDAVARVWKKLEGKDCIDRFVSLAQEKSKSKDKPARHATVRLAAVQALGAGKREDTAAVLIAACEDPEPTVVMAAAEGLASFATRMGPLAVQTLSGLVDHKVPGVRRAAADAFAAVGDASAGPALAKLLADKEWPVRAAAISACAQVRTREAVPLLIEMLKNEEGRLVEDAARALKSLTEMDLKDRYDDWKEWWGRVGPNFRVLTFEEIRQRDEAAAKEASEGAGKSHHPFGMGTHVEPVKIEARKDVVEYHGIVTPSKRVLFIVDISGSMEEFVVDRERFRERGFTKFRKIDILREELARTVANLDGYVRFNILAFATKVKPWRRDLVSANVVNKAAAVDYAQGLEPIGGNSADGLATAGLLGSAGLEEGRTNSYAALLGGLGVTGPADSTIDQPAEVDTVFFLSDGRPSVGEYVDTDEILEIVNGINRRRKIVLHVLAIGEFQRAWMERLAKENGGQFVDLGH